MPMKKILTFLLPLLAVAAGCSSGTASPCGETPEPSRQRLFVLTDVENEPDDSQSLVRLMLYSDVIDIEGICATTSTHMRDAIHPETIFKIISAYGQVRDNLLLHEDGFPDPDEMKAKVFRGQEGYGMSATGQGCSSEGSRAIVEALRRDDPRPLWVTAWGGVNTLAQALCDLKESETPENLATLISRLRVYTISDQDDSGIWIRRNFPGLFYIVSPGGYGNATWSGIMDASCPLVDNSVISNEWLAENIQQGHGPLGACYPDVAYGMEGDTPSWLGLIPNGLSDMEHPDWGGWGGRYEISRPVAADCDPHGFNGGVPIEDEPRDIWTNAIDEYFPYSYNAYGKAVRRSRISEKGYKVTQYRWREDYQNDMAARMDWCTMSYAEANHPPVPVLVSPQRLSVKSGEWFVMDASASYDPDGDSLSYLWFNYPEAGSLDTPVPIEGAENIHRVKVRAPQTEVPATLHFILRLSDKGKPSLSRYKRIIVEVTP